MEKTMRDRSRVLTLPVSPKRRVVGLRVFAGAVAFLAGCGWVGIAASVDSALSSDSSRAVASNSPPRAVWRPIDRVTSETVPIRIRFSDAEADPVSLVVEYNAGEGFQPARIDEGTVGIQAAPEESEVTLLWNANFDLGTSDFVADLVLRVTPSDAGGSGVAQESEPFNYGNDAPRVTDVSVDVNASGVAQGNVVVRFKVADSSADPISVVDFEFSRAGDFSDSESEQLSSGPMGSFPAGALTGLESSPAEDTGSSEEGTEHSVTWNSVGRLPGDYVGMAVRLRVADAVGASSDLVSSAPFTLANAALPDAVIVEPTSNPDSSGPILIELLVRQAADSPVDVVLQWSTDRTNFPPVDDLVDPALRQRVLLDPDERAPRRIVSPHLRTLTEARCRVFSNQPLDEVVLTDVRPAGFVGPMVVGHTLELLSEEAGVEQTRAIIEADGQFRLRTDAGLTPPPRQNQRVRIRESLAPLTMGLSSSAVGVTHYLAWDAPLDVGLGANDRHYFLRATAFSGVRRGLPTTSVRGKQIRTDGLAYVRPSTPHLDTGLRPSSVTIGDLNGDGHLDIVSADSNGNGLSVFLGTGGGAFRPGHDLRTGTDPRSVAAGDWNGDGHLDLVSADYASNQLSVFLGSGDGTFSQGTVLSSQVHPVSVTKGDLDGDQHLDLISANSLNSQLSVFLGVGDGTFSSPTILNTGGEPSSVSVGDLNGDGHLDLFSADASADEISLFLGHGDGTFGPRNALDTGDRPISVTAGDWNGDGHLDLASADLRSSQLSLFLGAGDGTFPGSQVLRVGQDPHFVAAGDLNRDGRLDLMAVGDSRVFIFTGAGDGTFSQPTLSGLATAGGSRSVATGDLNGDKRLDLVSADSACDELSIFLSNGGEFRQSTPQPTGNEPVSVTAGDWNGDGHLDLVSADRIANRLSIFLGAGDGTFSQRALLDTSAGLVSVVPVDWNGDGLLDLVSVHSSRLELFLGVGDGTFEPPAPPIPNTLHTGSGTTAVATGDWDGDGLPDLVATRSSELVIFRGVGNGEFSHSSLSTQAVASSVTTGDWNGDGHLDLVSASRCDRLLTLFLGSGSGDFSAASTLAAAGGPVSVATGDWNGDGHVDLASADFDACQLSIFLGVGNGTFSLLTHLPTGESPSFVTSGDLNGDECLDLVLATAFGDQLSVFWGGGDGSFSAQSDLLTREEPGRLFPHASVALGDWNRDGHLDLVSADVASDLLSVFLSADQNFQSPVLVGTPRVSAPTSGTPPQDGMDSVLLLGQGPDPHRIDTTAGTIDGVLSPALRGHAFHFSRIDLQHGATLIVSGEFPLTLLATGDVSIAGTIDCSGLSAQESHLPGPNRGGAGALGGPSGGRGGDGAGGVPGSGRLQGDRGQGPGGGQGGAHASGVSAPGAGGGHATRGQADSVGARGGGVYGNDLLSPLYGGGGGGGGSVCDDGSGALDPADHGGGGGGGGGGALRILAGGNLTVSGSILADGGDGARGNANRGGHGGGGAGGSILLQARGHITIGGTLSAVGGRGASGGSIPAGGNGGEGRIRLEDADGTVTVTATGMIRPSSQAGNRAILPRQGD